MSRENDLDRMRMLLNTDDGKLLLEEMNSMSGGSLMGADPQQTGYKVGKRELYEWMLRIAESKND